MVLILGTRVSSPIRNMFLLISSQYSIFCILNKIDLDINAI